MCMCCKLMLTYSFRAPPPPVILPCRWHRGFVLWGSRSPSLLEYLSIWLTPCLWTEHWSWSPLQKVCLSLLSLMGGPCFRFFTCNKQTRLGRLVWTVTWMYRQRHLMACKKKNWTKSVSFPGSCTSMSNVFNSFTFIVEQNAYETVCCMINKMRSTTGYLDASSLRRCGRHKLLRNSTVKLFRLLNIYILISPHIGLSSVKLSLCYLCVCVCVRAWVL